MIGASRDTAALPLVPLSTPLPAPTCTPVNLTVAFHFIIFASRLSSAALHRSLVYSRVKKSVQSSNYPVHTLPSIMTTAAAAAAVAAVAALLGLKDGHSERFDLAWASCKVHHPPPLPTPRTKPLIGDRKPAHTCQPKRACENVA